MERHDGAQNFFISRLIFNTPGLLGMDFAVPYDDRLCRDVFYLQQQLVVLTRVVGNENAHQWFVGGWF